MSGPRRNRIARLETLLAFDAQLQKGCLKQHGQAATWILGVDEVGRGSLIGPVVAAALVLPGDFCVRGNAQLADLDDSKAAHFTHAKRVHLAEYLKSACYWGIGEATRQEVETFNVSKASLLASHRAIQHLFAQFPHCLPQETLVVLDGKLTIPGLGLLQQAVVKGDQQSAAVAGASVIAKAHRDNWVIAMAAEYPGYGWEVNAGYPTPAHQKALAALGVTPLHRTTYKAVQQAMQAQGLLGVLVP